MESSNVAKGTFQITSTNAIQYLIAIESTLSAKLPTIQTLAIEVITAAGIYAFSLYTLKALNTQDFPHH